MYRNHTHNAVLSQEVKANKKDLYRVAVSEAYIYGEWNQLILEKEGFTTEMRQH
jgi:hypothetical protein